MIVSTASTEPASSTGDFASFAPASVSGLVLSAVLFQTVSVWPISISRAPMFEPILPMPAIPICIPLSFNCIDGCEPLDHPILDLGQSRNRAVVIEIAARRTADTDAADQLL